MPIMMELIAEALKELNRAQGSHRSDKELGTFRLPRD